jgi:methenyltetrahydrofolate cyclohydrolase
MHAYEPVLEALRLRRDDPDRDARVDAARTEASRSPLEIARIGAELTELAGELARTGNPNLSGDALAAAVLAEAGVQAAARLVAINLTEGPAVEESSQLAQKALAARERALG